jgi:hypothetical protein
VGRVEEVRLFALSEPNRPAVRNAREPDFTLLFEPEKG